MLRPYLSLWILLLAAACSIPTNAPNTENTPTDSLVVLSQIDSNSLDTLLPIAAPTIALPHTCTCKKRTYKRNPRTQLTFQAHQKASNEQKIREHLAEGTAAGITSLELVNYDTIPPMFNHFHNITKVVLSSCQGAIGLDIFPNLEEVHFMDGQVTLEQGQQWTKRIKILGANKTVLEGIDQFSDFPKLEIIDFAYAGFRKFPTGLEQLSCLQEVHLMAYINGQQTATFDLSSLDLSQLPCLRMAHFHTWQNTMTGVPQQMLSPQLSRVEVVHKNLTQQEQLELKDVKNILFNRGSE